MRKTLLAALAVVLTLSATIVAPPAVTARPPTPKAAALPTVSGRIPGPKVLPSPSITSGKSRANKIVYLTFDDGPDRWNDPRLLRILRDQRVPATFFVLGQAAAANRSAITQFYLAGHALGNHSYTHTDLSRLSLPAVTYELRAAQRALGSMGGRCFRPPYGAMGPAVTAAARAQGLTIVMWSVDPEDWAHQNTTYLVNHVLSHVRNRSIVLMHDGGGSRAATVSAVQRLIPALRARGYEFRTVPSCRVPLGGREADMAQRVAPKPKPTPTPTPTPTQTASPAVTP